MVNINTKVEGTKFSFSLPEIKVPNNGWPLQRIINKGISNSTFDEGLKKADTLL